MRRSRLSFLLLVAFLETGTSPANGQELRLYVPPDSVSVGEPFTVSIVARHSTYLTLQVPYESDGEPARFGDVILTALEARDRRVEGDVVRDSLAFEAIVLQLESASTRGSGVLLRGRDTTLVVAVPVVEIGVRATTDPEARPRDVSPILTAPPPLWWVLIPLVIVVLFLIGVSIWRRRSIPAASVDRPRLPPLEEAMAALDDLSDGGSREHDRTFVIQLSDVIRTYISRRLTLPARESTSHELFSDLTGHPAIAPTMVDALRPMMNMMDAVKFARQSLPCSRDALLGRIRQWIQEADRLVQAHESAPTAEGVESDRS